MAVLLRKAGRWAPQNAAIKAGETSPAVTFTHTVTKEEAEQGYLQNQAAAEYTVAEEDEDRLTWSNEVLVATGIDAPRPEEITLSLSKAVTNPPANGIAYVEHETINYLITFVNASDVEVKVMDLADTVFNSLFSVTAHIGVGKIAPHDSVSIPYSHMVTDVDVQAGYVVNLAEMTVEAATGDGFQKYYLSDMVKVDTMPGEPESVRTYPSAYKFETSHPKNGVSYTEGETVEYDVVLYNPTGRVFSDIDCYDILLVDDGFWHSALAALDAAPHTIHVQYKVTDLDVAIGSIYNIAWFTLFDDEYDELVTVYSNEIEVDTGDKPVPPALDCGDHCEYSIVSRGEGAELIMNRYCREHGAVEATVDRLFEEAANEEEKARAWALAAEIWRRAFDDEYQRLIEAAQGDLKAALEKDYKLSAALTDLYADRLKAQGKEESYVNEQLSELLRDRVCELCFTAATAPEERQGLHAPETEIKRRSAAACSVTFDAGEAAFYCKTLNVCDRHMPLVRAADRLLGADVSVNGWEKAAAYWLGAVKGSYDSLTRAADPIARHYLMTERAAFDALLAARKALYGAYYADALLSAEMAYRQAREWAMLLCE